jgi:hypothetical protein
VLVLFCGPLGCASSGGGASATEAARAAAAEILEKDLTIADATLVGRFILEDERGSRRGSLRIRYIGPDLYRVDVFLSGAAGVGGGSSFLVEGDSTLVYADPEGGAESSSVERESVFPLLEDFNLQIQDLKALAAISPYLGALDLSRTRGSRVRGGYLLEGNNPVGDTFAVWLNTEKDAVVKAQRADRAGPPVVETKLSRFQRFGGVWRATRIEIRHFGENASLSVQYERMSVNEGLRRDDLLLRGMAH